jgi:DNA polymerase-3 subunit epsilon
MEPPAQHDLRLATALAALRLRAWPFAGRVGLREADEVHVFDHWRFVASARDPEALAAAWEAPAGGFDLDTYRILLRQLERGVGLDLLQAPRLDRRTEGP